VSAVHEGISGGNTHYQMYSRAGSLRVRDTKPLPTEADYQAWMDAHFNKPNSLKHVKWTARKLRLAVVMRRNGCPHAELRDALGMKSASAISSFLSNLPEELRP